MPLRTARPAILLSLIVLLVTSTACRTTRGDGTLPAWSGDPAAGLDARVSLTGVGSARGDGADAAEAARRAAMAAILEQLVARVEAQTDSHQRESDTEHLDADGLVSTVSASNVRERIIRVTSEGELLGASFELARAPGRDGPVTWARAVVDRAEMAEHTLATVREDLSRARAALDTARRALGRPGAPADQVALAIRETLAADRALSGPRAVVPLLTAIRPASPGAAAGDTALIGSLDRDVSALLATIASRFDARLIGEARVGFVGQPAPVTLQALWDGAPLPGLALAAAFGDGPAALGVTSEQGRVAFSVPAPRSVAGHGLRVGPAGDGALGPVQVLLPASFLRPADARIAVLSRHERQDAGGGPARSVRPSPLQPDIEALLGRLRFPVVSVSSSTSGPPDAPSRFAGVADYVLQVETRTTYSSVEGPSGPYWYRSAVALRLTELSSGETLSIAGPDAKAAGASPDQAAQRSLAAAMQALSRPDDPASLIGVLDARFR
jgi:hypothetical protein